MSKDKSKYLSDDFEKEFSDIDLALDVSPEMPYDDDQQQKGQNPGKQFFHSAASVSVPATTVCLPVRFPKHCSGQSANSARPRISPSETVL